MRKNQSLTGMLRRSLKPAGLSIIALAALAVPATAAIGIDAALIGTMMQDGVIVSREAALTVVGGGFVAGIVALAVMGRDLVHKLAQNDRRR